MSKLEDEKILRLSLKDPSQFSVLIDRYQAPFLKAALGVVRNRQEAEDIVQETFTKIYLNAKDYKKAVIYYEDYNKTTKSVEALYEMALCYRNLGKFEASLKALDSALRLDNQGIYTLEIDSLRSDVYGKKEIAQSAEPTAASNP